MKILKNTDRYTVIQKMFDNGYGVSYFHNRNKKVYECAVLKEYYKLEYSTDLTSDVELFTTFSEVRKFVRKVRKLPNKK